MVSTRPQRSLSTPSISAGSLSPQTRPPPPSRRLCLLPQPLPPLLKPCPPARVPCSSGWSEITESGGAGASSPRGLSLTDLTHYSDQARLTIQTRPEAECPHDGYAVGRSQTQFCTRVNEEKCVEEACHPVNACPGSQLTETCAWCQGWRENAEAAPLPTCPAPTAAFPGRPCHLALMRT